jgi:hypothetical protein
MDDIEEWERILKKAQSEEEEAIRVAARPIVGEIIRSGVYKRRMSRSHRRVGNELNRYAMCRF